MCFDKVLHFVSKKPGKPEIELGFIGANISGEYRGRFVVYLLKAGIPLPLFGAITASRKPEGYNKALLQQFGEVIQAWMISQILVGTEGLDQLVCDGKTLRDSTIETEEGNHRYGLRPTSSTFPRSRSMPVSGSGISPEGLRHPRVQQASCLKDDDFQESCYSLAAF